MRSRQATAAEVPVDGDVRRRRCGARMLTTAALVPATPVDARPRARRLGLFSRLIRGCPRMRALAEVAELVDALA